MKDTTLIESGQISAARTWRYRGKILTVCDFETLVSIKDSVECGHDVEVRGTPDGSLKVLEITRKNISAR